MDYIFFSHSYNKIMLPGGYISSCIHIINKGPMSSSKSLFLKIILKNILFVGIVDNHDLPDMIVCLIALTSLALIYIHCNYEEFTSTQ